MGLCIHYDLSAPTLKSPAAARKIVADLQTFATTLHLKSVSKILTWKRGNDPMVAMMHEFPIYNRDDKANTQIFFAKPLEMLFFLAQHPGSEPALFGLARYSKTARDMETDEARPSNLTGWHWHHSCKTQYASMENEGGFPNFFAIHDGICQILDHAATLGLTLNVVDESNYWQHRNKSKLHAEIDRWNAMIAAVVGRFKDQSNGTSGQVTAAPILNAPNFEHLEAKGQPFLEVTPEVHVIRHNPKPKRKPSRRPRRGQGM